MGGLKLGGKDVRSIAKPAAPPRATRRVVEPAPVDWQDPYADPFPPPDVTDPELAASNLADTAIWLQQWISEVAALARKLDKLRAKLSDPKLADNPHRSDAIRKAEGIEVDMINLARDVVWTEASCSRTWSALTPRQRHHADCYAHWHTPPDTPTLIGAAFQRIGSFETWPREWRFRRAWINDFPYLLIHDAREAGLFDWRPSPSTAADPFGGEIVHDAQLARELEGRK